MSKTRMKVAGLAMLMAGVSAGVGGTLIAQTYSTPRYINTGLFSLIPGEGARFHVSLDDRETAVPTRVLLQLFNYDGVAVVQKEVALQPGRSATLDVTGPGLYRAHARVLDPDEPLGTRRTVVATVEIVSNEFGHPERPVCTYDDSMPSGRP